MCFSTLLLNAGNTGAIYYWSNGSTDQTLLASTTGLTYDYQTYTVQVQNSYGCIDSATIHISFTFAGCLGIKEKTARSDWKIYPNPAIGEVYIEIEHPDKNFVVQLIDKLGRVVEEKNFSATPGNSFHGMIRVNNLPAGTYYVMLKDSSGWDIKSIVIR
jgi:hypothetical protein